MKESDLFVPVKELLMKSGSSEVYGEVLGLDVLGINGVCNIGVELKKTLSFKLLDQALDRLSLVEYLYIAIPKRKTHIPRIVERFLRENRIGLIEVSNGYANVVISAKFNRLSRRIEKRGIRNFNIRDHIQEYHKNQIGGVKSGEGETQYSLMIKEVKFFVKYRGKNKGVTIDQILEHCETYYANPKPSLVATLRANWNQDWCEIYIKDGVRYFRYIEND